MTTGNDLIYGTGVDNSGLKAGLEESRQIIAKHVQDVKSMQMPASIAGGQFFGTSQFVPPASAMTAMVPARGTPGGFAMPGGFGGGGGAFGANPNAGAAAAAIGQFAQAIGQATAQLQGLAAAAGQARGGNFGPGGGVGGMGRGGGALGQYSNPFGPRGLARLLGSGMAAYGIMQATHIAGNIVEGFDTIGHPERQLTGFDTINRRGPVAGDSFMTGQAQRVANVTGGQQLMNSFNSIPILGGITSTIFRASGATGAIDDELREARKQMEVHEQVLQMAHESELETARLTGDTVGEARLRGFDRVNPALQAYNQGIRDQLPTSEIDLRRTVMEGRQRVTDLDVGQAQSRQTSLIAVAGDRTRAYEAETRATDAMRTGFTNPLADARAAMGFRQTKEREDLSASQPSTEGMDPSVAGPKQKEYAAARSALDSKQAKEREDFERNAGQRVVDLKAEQEASILRTEQRGYEAQLSELKAANAKQVAEMQAHGATVAEIEQAQATNTQRQRELTSAHDRDLNAFNTQVQSSIRSSQFRAAGQGYAAQLNDFDTDTQRMVLAADPERRQAINNERAAQRMTLGAAHQGQINDSYAGLQARQEEAAIRADTSLPSSVQNERAGLAGQVARYKAELTHTDPELYAEAKKTALAELKAQQVQLNTPQSDGFAQVLDPTRQVIGDPLGALPATQRIAAMNVALTKAQANLTSFTPQIAVDPTVAAQMGAMQAGMGAAGMFGSGAFGALATGPQSEKPMSDATGQKIAAALAQLIGLVTAGSGMGVPFGGPS